MISLRWPRSLCPNEASPAATAPAFLPLAEIVCPLLGRESGSECCVLHSAPHQNRDPEPMSDPRPVGVSGRSAEHSSGIDDPRTRAPLWQPGKMLGKSSSAFAEALREHQGTRFSCSFHQGSQQSCKGKSLRRILPEAQKDSGVQ